MGGEQRQDGALETFSLKVGKTMVSMLRELTLCFGGEVEEVGGKEFVEVFSNVC